MINSFITRQFFNITQIELDPSKLITQNICEICFDTTKEFAEFKRKLIHNQQTLSDSMKCEVVNLETLEISYSENSETPSNIEIEDNEADLEIESILIEEEHLESSTEEVLNCEVVVESNKTARRRRKEKKKLCSGTSYSTLL